MIKYICDRCGKECEKLHSLKIPIKKLSDSSCLSKHIDVCTECDKEADVLFDILADIRLIMFDKYMPQRGDNE